MNDPEDKTLESRLDGESEISRAYAALERAEPSAELDRQILDAGRAALQPDKVVRLGRWRRLSLPLALAASTIIAVPLVVRVFDASQPSIGNATLDGVATTPAAGQPQRESVGRPDGTFASTPAAQNDPPIAQPAGAARADTEADSISAGDRRQAQPDTAPRLAATPQQRSAPAESAPLRDPATPAAEDFAPPPPTSIAKTAPAVAAPAPDHRHLDNASRAADSDYAGESVAVQRRSTVSALQQSHQATGSAPARSPQQWLDEIVVLHKAGATAVAKRQLGEFLRAHPDYVLPPGLPLQRADAAYASDSHIVQDAETWLAGIAALARAGRIDAARQQLAQFLQSFPNHELPEDFPLDRADAAPIER